MGESILFRMEGCDFKLKSFETRPHDILSHLHVVKLGKVPVHRPKREKYHCPICGKSLLRTECDFKYELSKTYDNVVNKVTFKCCECKTEFETDAAIATLDKIKNLDWDRSLRHSDYNKRLLNLDYYDPKELSMVAERPADDIGKRLIGYRVSRDADNLEAPALKTFALASLLVGTPIGIAFVPCRIVGIVEKIIASIILALLCSLAIFLVIILLSTPFDAFRCAFYKNKAKHKIVGDEDEETE